jgi:hypothetical protein
MLFQAPARSAITPEELTDVIATRPTPAGEYFGAVVEQAFDFSIPGAVVRDFRLPDDDRMVDPSQKIGRAPPRYVPSGVPVLTEDEWKSSPHYREAIPYDGRMTEARAKAKADVYDRDQYNSWLRQNREMGVGTAALAVTGSLLGAAPDPTNYIPVFGPAFKAAAAGRAANILRRAGAQAVDAAAVTALVTPAIAQSRREFGDDVGFADILLDIGLSAALGGVFGGAVGWRERLPSYNPKLAGDALQVLGEGAEAMARGEEIDVGPAVLAMEGATRRRLMGGTSIATPSERFIPERPSRPQVNARSAVSVDIPALNRDGSEMVFDNPKAVKKAISNAKRQGIELSETRLDDGTYRVTQRVEFEVLDDYVERAAAEAAMKRIPPRQRAGLEVVPLLQDDGTIRSGIVRGLSPSQANMARANPEMLKGAVDRAEAAAQIPEARPFPSMVLDAWTGPKAEPPSPYAWMRRGGPVRRDPSPARPLVTTQPERLAEADAAVGKPEAKPAQLAKERGVDLETGDAPELADIERMRKAGALSPTEIATLDDAGNLVSRADDYAKAFEAAAFCLARRA